MQICNYFWKRWIRNEKHHGLVCAKGMLCEYRVTRCRKGGVPLGALMLYRVVLTIEQYRQGKQESDEDGHDHASNQYDSQCTHDAAYLSRLHGKRKTIGHASVL